LFAVAGLSLACSDNISGRLTAVHTGSLGAPPLERVVPDAARPCGPPAVTPLGEKQLRRQPYLQRVGADHATVLWTAAVTAAPPTLVATAPDGSPLAEVQAQVDTTAPLPSGTVQWSATMSGLPASATICYQLRQDGEALMVAGSIATAPPPGTDGRVRALVFGDSGGGGADQRALFDQMNTVPFDLMLHTGDIAYEDGELGELERNFFRVYAPILRHTPIFPASGNHDYRTGDAAPFRQVFALPENGGPSGRERWYSFDWGDVHFVALDTQRMGAEQAAWLDADLAANHLRWTVVYGHRPPYSSGDHGGDGTFRRELMPVLEKHRVDLVLAGHDHHYERFLPKANTTYVVTGGGGRGVRSVGGASDTAFAEAVIHLVVVDVQGDVLSLHAIDGVGREFDSAVVRKPS
jgi:acid phosphatase type 7